MAVQTEARAPANPPPWFVTQGRCLTTPGVQETLCSHICPPCDILAYFYKKMHLLIFRAPPPPIPCYFVVAARRSAPHALWGSSCLDVLSPAIHGYSSVAQTFGKCPCSLKNRALGQDILNKSACLWIPRVRIAWKFQFYIGSHPKRCFVGYPDVLLNC